MASAANRVVVNATTRHTATIIFAHGLGDTGNGWLFLVENFRRRQLFPEIKFILPTAPVIPITFNLGCRMNGWYDIPVLGKNILAMLQNEDKEGVLKARDFFHSLIKEEMSAGIPSERIMVGGFSQGAGVCIFSGLTAAVKLAGMFGLSAYIPLLPSLREMGPARDTLANIKTPILLAHGTEDQIVPYGIAELTTSFLKDVNFDVEFKTFPGLGHEACPEEIDEVQKFIGERLPPLEKSD